MQISPDKEDFECYNQGVEETLAKFSKEEFDAVVTSQFLYSPIWKNFNRGFGDEGYNRNYPKVIKDISRVLKMGGFYISNECQAQNNEVEQICGKKGFCPILKGLKTKDMHRNSTQIAFVKIRQNLRQKIAGFFYSHESPKEEMIIQPLQR